MSALRARWSSVCSPGGGLGGVWLPFAEAGGGREACGVGTCAPVMQRSMFGRGGWGFILNLLCRTRVSPSLFEQLAHIPTENQTTPSPCC